MYLTGEEESIVQGEKGKAMQKAMKILTTLGDIYDADRLIPVKSAQISGVSYKTVGEAGLRFIEDFSKDERAKVSVPTTLNPAGMDLSNWGKMKIDEDFADKQERVIDAFKKMDVTLTCTCTPYLSGNLPKFGDHLAWAESSAVSFANSIIGARTNREGGPSSLAASIIGKVPEYGLHLKENRKATKIIKINFEPSDMSEFSGIGIEVGDIVGDGIPYFKDLRLPSIDHGKILGAAMAASGSVALYHVEEETPEWENAIRDDLEVIEIEREDLEFRKDEDKPDLIYVGCPHASLEEIREVSDFIENISGLSSDLWVSTSSGVKELASKQGYVEKIEEKGGLVITDTCPVVAPLENYKVIGTNSGKAAEYLPTMNNKKVIFDSIKNLLSMVED